MCFFGFSKDEWKWPAMCLAIRIIGVMTSLNVMVDQLITMFPI